MASKALMAAIVILATIAAPAMAKQYVVGDESGWTVDVDYVGWTTGKQFYVGDSLVFNYPQGVHNVIKVNGTVFQTCDIDLTNADTLSAGNDVITLTQAGKKWYVCGFGEHCSLGMKLVIDVWPVSASAPAPAPAPTEYYPVVPEHGLGEGWFGTVCMSLWLCQIIITFFYSKCYPKCYVT